ncbi:uncharacterized protein LOC111706978 [Eurytemora carolleeae]|uniref:uncharacterized protein LOC111706978 n=1 Tax=Eurytemora carolleeae TaxID=1294199 RepID=UPI000C78DA36|nr:uncharacterized protein LOC111706978 [Eurytemora carolleeae]|eukprot:XP_023335714.1 uncharacterized protein LOC111706978 [Eurytemora affinis]
MWNPKTAFRALCTTVPIAAWSPNQTRAQIIYARAWPTSASLLKRQFRVRTKPTDAEKMFEFLKTMPKVESVEKCKGSPRDKMFKTAYLITFTDAAACDDFKAEKVVCPYGRLDRGVNQYHMSTKRPTNMLGRALRHKFFCSVRYIKAYADTGELEREVLILARGQCTKAEKMREWLVQNDVADVEKVRPVLSKFPTKQVLVLFKTPEAAQMFLKRDLLMMEKKVDAILYSDIGKLIDRFPSDGKVDGDNEYSSRDPSTRIYVQLYSEAFKQLVDILDIFQDEELEDCIQLPSDIPSLIGGEEMLAKPSLLLSYKTAAKVTEVLERVDDFNTDKTYREWVYATSLSQQIKDRRVGQYLRSDCTDSAEICQTFFEKTDDYVKFAPPNSNPKKEKKAKAEPIAAAAAVSAAGASVKKESMDVTVLNTNRQVEMGEWVVCVLQQNFAQVAWIASDSQEIGRYFFENHANVLEIKMRNNSDIVYVRFGSPKDALVFVGLSYVMFLGVYVQRCLFFDHPYYRMAEIRAFLGGPLTVQNGHLPKNDARNIITKVATVPGSVHNNGILFTGFTTKFTNAQIFERLKSEIGLEKPSIVKGDWKKEGDNWNCIVLLDLGVEEINRYADRWTNLRVIMGEHAIKAEFYAKPPPAPKKKAPRKTTKRTRGDSESTGTNGVKKMKNIEKYLDH